jgi:preprotein translocase subunit SecE
VSGKESGTMSEATEKAPEKSWFKGLQAEFKKIIWPDKKSLTRQTIAVVATSVALGIIIKILDVIMTYGIDALIKL